CLFVFSSRRRHTRFSRDWSSDVCSSDLAASSCPSRTWRPPRPPRSERHAEPRRGPARGLFRFRACHRVDPAELPRLRSSLPGYCGRNAPWCPHHTGVNSMKNVPTLTASALALALGFGAASAWAEESRTSPLLLAAGESTMDEAGDAVSDTWITTKV